MCVNKKNACQKELTVPYVSTKKYQTYMFVHTTERQSAHVFSNKKNETMVCSTDKYPKKVKQTKHNFSKSKTFSDKIVIPFFQSKTNVVP